MSKCCNDVWKPGMYFLPDKISIEVLYKESIHNMNNV